MSGALIAIAILVVVVLAVGLLGHVLIYALVGAGCFAIGRAYEQGRLALGRRKARGSLGK